MTPRLREPQAPSVGDTRPAARPWRFGPYDNLRGWLRGLAIAMAVGLFLAFAGAFGTLEAPLWRRLLYWLSLMLVGTFAGGGMARLFFPRRERPCPFVELLIRTLLASVAMAIPFTGVVWAGSIFILGGDMSAQRLPYLFLAVFMVAAAVTALNLLVERPGPATPPTAAPAAPVKFLERLPLRLRGATLYAVEAEDHYLRLHTSKGQDLILLRLADAVDELQGLEGAQVHRSWWVAREAVVDVRRGDGRATLTLVDGAQVPVSRTYSRLLREAGWY